MKAETGVHDEIVISLATKLMADEPSPEWRRGGLNLRPRSMESAWYMRYGRLEMIAKWDKNLIELLYYGKDSSSDPRVLDSKELTGWLSNVWNTGTENPLINVWAESLGDHVRPWEVGALDPMTQRVGVHLDTIAYHDITMSIEIIPWEKLGHKIKNNSETPWVMTVKVQLEEEDQRSIQLIAMKHETSIRLLEQCEKSGKPPVFELLRSRELQKEIKGFDSIILMVAPLGIWKWGERFSKWEAEQIEKPLNTTLAGIDCVVEESKSIYARKPRL